MELHDVSHEIEYVARPLLLDLFCSFSLLKINFCGLGVENNVSNGLDTAYWGFLGVGITFDIFQNIILIPYLEYGVLSPLDTANCFLIFCVFGKYRHGYAVTMETRGRKKVVGEPEPPARDPRDVETIERLCWSMLMS
ncbi:hypothetical protein Tco_0594281 [Tanacetum coccineum]